MLTDSGTDSSTKALSPIPLVDLKLQHDRIADEVRAGFDRVMAQSTFILGPEVVAFEEAYADFCGVAHCVGVANGTDAVELALRAVGVGRGDEVIIPANTFVATAEAVLRAGADPVLVDCGEDYLIDVDQVAARITAKTKAVVPVHLYGQMASMKQLGAVVGPGVAIVEDAAQSHGARHGDARSGSLGRAAATSFYPGKNLGAYGDAGAVTTNDGELATRLRILRNHGGIAKYEHVQIGVNSRLSGLQAVVLSAKLKMLDDWNAERVQAARRYDELLAGEERVVRPMTADNNEHVWHLYVVQIPRRDEILATLNAAGIGAGIHYRSPVHLLDAFAYLGAERGSFPRAEHLCERILSLPIYPGITAEQQQRVVDELVAALG